MPPLPRRAGYSGHSRLYAHPRSSNWASVRCPLMLNWPGSQGGWLGATNLHPGVRLNQASENSCHFSGRFLGGNYDR